MEHRKYLLYFLPSGTIQVLTTQPVAARLKYPVQLVLEPGYQEFLHSEALVQVMRGCLDTQSSPCAICFEKESQPYRRILQHLGIANDNFFFSPLLNPFKARVHGGQLKCGGHGLS